jgi:hypothetical protein
MERHPECASVGPGGNGHETRQTVQTQRTDASRILDLTQHRRVTGNGTFGERLKDSDTPHWTDWLELFSCCYPDLCVPGYYVGLNSESATVTDNEPLLTIADMRRVCDRVERKLHDDGVAWEQLRLVEKVLTVLAAELERAVHDYVAHFGESRETRMAEAATRVCAVQVRHVRRCHLFAPRTVMRHHLLQAARRADDALALVVRLET